MSRYTVEFFWSKDVPNVVDERRRILVSEDLAAAKLEAAILYAEPSKGPAPSAYRLVQDGGLEVYRYPTHFH